MRWFHVIYLVVGVAILGLIAGTTDLAAAIHQIRAMGWGFAIVLALYMAEFIASLVAWHVTFEGLPMNWRWSYRLWRVRMVGEAFNTATPFARMGGEPLKAFILKRQYGIEYPRSFASILLSTTVIVISLVIFLVTGFVLLLDAPYLANQHKSLAGFGLGLFIAAIALFFAIQRWGLASRGLRRWEKGHAAGFLQQLRAVETRLITFYTARPARFAMATLAAFANWAFGVVTLYYTFQFLGTPISLRDAWIAESFTQLIRATTFFIPANLGTQDGAFVLITTAITGDPALGLAVALVRRGREIVWVVWGLALGWRYVGKREEIADFSSLR